MSGRRNRSVFAAWPLLCFFFAGSVSSQDNTLHYCTMDDLKGVYVMVNFRQAPIGKETVWEQQFPYQYLAFYPGHIFAMVAVAREIRDPAKLSSYMNAQYQSLKQKFFPDDAGHLLFLRPMQTERYQCVAAGSTRGEYKKGDLILTRTDDKEGSDVYKLYRRWY